MLGGDGDEGQLSRYEYKSYSLNDGVDCYGKDDYDYDDAGDYDYDDGDQVCVAYHLPLISRPRRFWLWQLPFSPLI